MKTTQETTGKDDALAFTFGDPEPVLDRSLISSLGVALQHNGSYYEPPVPWAGLARLRGANAYHGPLLEFKANMILRDIVTTAAVPFRELMPFVTDFVTFANAYFQKIRNRAGEVVYLKHLPGINMRRMKDRDRFCMLQETTSPIEFQPGEVYHLKNYDVVQTIYGLPAYLGAIQSMLLNEDATLFRRRYYLNGAHVGYIFYSAAGNLGDTEKNAIRDAVKSTKKIGNFRNLFLHIPNGREKDIQIIPVGDFSSKDELQKIKDISRDDIIAAHRIPPALASIVPAERTGPAGDITKSAEVYLQNEIKPLRKIVLQINELLSNTKQLTLEE